MVNMVCKLFYYKCPVCNMSQSSVTLLRYHFGNKCPSTLGYFQTRINHGGRVGIKRVSFEPLVDVLHSNSDGELLGNSVPNQILDRIRHAVVGTFNALDKYNLLEEKHYPRPINKSRFAETKKAHEDILYKFDNLKNKHKDLKDRFNDLFMKYQNKKSVKSYRNDYNVLVENYNDVLMQLENLKRKYARLREKYDEQQKAIMENY